LDLAVTGTNFANSLGLKHGLPANPGFFAVVRVSLSPGFAFDAIDNGMLLAPQKPLK
jgi:hypothetical protein